MTVTLAMRGDANVSTALDSPHPRLMHAMAHSIVGSEPQQAERQERSAVNATAERILEYVECTERLKEARNGFRGFAGWSVDQPVAGHVGSVAPYEGKHQGAEIGTVSARAIALQPACHCAYSQSE